jgi:AhpD family alkylhydroperoxidase
MMTQQTGTTMNRVNIKKIQPDAYTALFGLENYLANASLPVLLQELVRLRASQINGCNFCKSLHYEAARKHGETEERLVALANWREAGLFDKKEQAALAVTEAVTLISDRGLPDELYQQVTEFFSEEEIAQLIMLIATINAWNRISVATSS